MKGLFTTLSKVTLQIKFKPSGRLYPTIALLAILAPLGLGCISPAAIQREEAPRKIVLQKPARAVASKELAVSPKPARRKERISDREELMAYQEAVRIFREEGRAQTAYDMLDAFLHMHPDSRYADDALLEQVRIMASLDKPREALRLARRLLRDYTNSPLRKKTFLLQGDISLGMEKWKDCVRSMDNALTLDLLPMERAEALDKRSVCLLKRKRYRQAFMGARDALLSSSAVGVSKEIGNEARKTLAQSAAGLGDKALADILAESDGTEPFVYLAMEQLRRMIEKGLYREGMNDLTDILTHYPGLAPQAGIDEAYDILSGHLLVQGDTIGAILPLSGRYQIYGEKALQGIQSALGLMSPLPPDESSPHFTLVTIDSGTDPLKAAQAVTDLAGKDHVLAIIGPLFSRTSKTAAQAAQKSNVPIITLSADPSIPKTGDNVFRRALSDSQQISSLVAAAHDRFMMTRFALLYPDTAYGREMMNRFWDELDKRGAEVTAVESFPPGVTDFGPQIRSLVGLDRKLSPEDKLLKENGADVKVKPIVDFDAIFIPAGFQTVGLLAPQLAFYDITNALLLGTDGWNNPWVVELGEHYVEGAIFTGGYLADMANPVSRKFSARYWLSFGEDPQPLAAQAFDAASLIRSGLESGMVKDRSSLRNYLMNLTDAPSAEGPLTTGPDGDIAQRPHLLTVERGKIKPFVPEID